MRTWIRQNAETSTDAVYDVMPLHLHLEIAPLGFFIYINICLVSTYITRNYNRDFVIYHVIYYCDRVIYPYMAKRCNL